MQSKHWGPKPGRLVFSPSPSQIFSRPKRDSVRAKVKKMLSYRRDTALQGAL